MEHVQSELDALKEKMRGMSPNDYEVALKNAAKLQEVIDKLTEERGLAKRFFDAQERLTELADELEKLGIYIHRDLATLPDEYVKNVNAYLTEGAENITFRQIADDWEVKYEKGRGDLFDCLHEKGLLEEKTALLETIRNVMAGEGYVSTKYHRVRELLGLPSIYEKVKE